MRVKQEEHGQVPKVRVEYTPVALHALRGSGVRGGSAPDAVDRSGTTVLVLLDPANALMGRRELVRCCCPVRGRRLFNEEADVAAEMHRAAPTWFVAGQTAALRGSCAPTGALRFGDEEEFADELPHAETYLLEEGCRPRVFYLNRPHLFLAGDVWDPACDEIVEGARVTLAMPDGTVRKTVTDDFGDFYFRKLDEGVYDVAVEADGYRPVERRGIELKKSLNLGDFALVRA